MNVFPSRLTSVIVAVLMLLAHTVVAQKAKFLPGYLVTTEGDTLRGFIQDLPLSGNYDSCIFKTQLNSNPQTYYPAKLKAYQLADRKVMASRTIQYKEKTKEVYLEVLADGKATLFRYKKYDDGYYFVEKSGTDFQPLTSETVMMDGIYRRDNKFKVVLTKMFADCSSFDLSQLDRVLLQEKSLTQVVENYNQCIRSPAVASTKKKPWSFHFGILAGIISSTYHAPDLSDVTSHGFNGPYDATTFEFGASFEWNSASTGLGSSFRADLVYFGPHYTGSKTESGLHYESTLDVQQLKLPLTYKYALGSEEFSTYFLLGASVAYTMDVQSNLTLSSISGAFPDEHYEDTIPMDLLLGYFGGLGVTARITQSSRLFLEVRAERALNMTSLVALTGIRF